MMTQRIFFQLFMINDRKLLNIDLILSNLRSIQPRGFGEVFVGTDLPYSVLDIFLHKGTAYKCTVPLFNPLFLVAERFKTKSFIQSNSRIIRVDL